MKSKLKLGDFIILVIVISMALLSMVAFIQKKSSETQALIIKNGEVLYNIKLNEVKERVEIKSQGKYNELIVAENGKIRFEESGCPDKVCVKTGWISRPGQSAVCLPAGIVIKIVGEDNEDFDIIVR